MADDVKPTAEVEYRPLSRRQIAELRGYVATITTLGRGLLFLLALAVLGLLLRVLLKAAAVAVPVLGHPVWWIIPTCLAGLVLYRRSSRWTGGATFRARVRRDLERGMLAIRRIEAVDAIEMEEVEDLGPCYFILTRDGKTMLFDGQYLEGHRRRGFPWTSFEIREAPESGVFFGLHRTGEHLTPSARRPPLPYAERKALGSFNRRYQTLAVDFAALKKQGRPISSA